MVSTSLIVAKLLSLCYILRGAILTEGTEGAERNAVITKGAEFIQFKTSRA